MDGTNVDEGSNGSDYEGDDDGGYHALMKCIIMVVLMVIMVWLWW